MSSTITTHAPGAAPLAPATRSPWLRPKYLLFAFLGLMYAYVLWNNERFLINSKDPEWPHIESFKWILLPHGLAAACALFLGPLQFSDRLRRRFAKAHRVMGRFYVGGVVIGAPIGIYIQYFEERMGESRSFTVATVVDAVVWILATVIAMVFILRGKVQQHRQWMTRSFTCAIIFLEVRTIAGLAHWEQYTEIIVWSCVAAAFPLADLVLQIEDSYRTRATLARKAQRAA
jgi:uncharacterized membrane protein